MSSRKHRRTRRAHYRARPDYAKQPDTRFARSGLVDPAPPAIRDPRPFQLGEAIAERLPDVDDILAGEVVDDD